MGLKGCPGSFARLMDMALKGIDRVLIYIDDVLIHGRTKEEAIAVLDTVLKRLAQHNLKVNLAKSTFLQPKTDYLGYTLSMEGIYPGRSKTKAILDAQPPTTQKQLKSFLGMVNYYRNFVKHFAHKAGKLYALTTKDSYWKQGPLPTFALHIFQELKQAIAKTVPRAFPFKQGRYHLFTDGSLGDTVQEGGLGGHLMQEDAKGQLHSIGWASRALLKHEKNYSAFLLELAAAVYAIDYFSHYLKGAAFTLYTDHAPLTKLSTVHTKTLHRLHALLNEYSFDIKHVAGKENAVADFLSRSHGPATVNAIAAMADLENLRHLQEKCPTLGPVYTALATNKQPQWPANLAKYQTNISLHQGILCIQLPPRPGYYQDNKLRALVPIALRAALMQEAHNSALGGHQGIFRTMERIKLSFWWPTMEQDVHSHLRQCQSCQATANKDATPPLLATRKRV